MVSLSHASVIPGDGVIVDGRRCGRRKDTVGVDSFLSAREPTDDGSSKEDYYSEYND